MNAAGRLSAFAGGVAVLAAGAAVVGGATDPDVGDTRDGSHGGTHPPKSGQELSAVPGLAVAADGYGLDLGRRELPRGKRTRLAFRITDHRARAVKSFTVAHEKRMHLIVARRDGRGFQHLHPTMSADGRWSVPVKISDAGSYRVFADFRIGKRALTLGADLAVDGEASYAPLPTPAAAARTATGFQVRLDAGRPRAGGQARLRFSVLRAGRIVRTEPYLGAGGHLVALREGDLGYLHTHPAGHGDDVAGHHDGIAFETEFPSAGRYRLYFQFRVDGRVHTAEFTREVMR